MFAFFTQHWLKFTHTRRFLCSLSPSHISDLLLKYFSPSWITYSRSYHSGSLSLTPVLSRATWLCICSWKLICWPAMPGQLCSTGVLMCSFPAHHSSSWCSYQSSQCFYRVAPDQCHQNHHVAQCSFLKPYSTIPDPTFQLGTGRAVYHPLKFDGQWSEHLSLEVWCGFWCLQDLSSLWHL